MCAVLAIETSTESCSVALWYRDKLFTREALAPRAHARVVFGQLDAVFNEAGCVKHTISGLILGAGPGSFTGLRVSASVIQGILAGLDCSVVRVSSLQAMAEQAYRLDGQTSVIPVLDARMGESYWGQYYYDPDIDLMVNVVPDQVNNRPMGLEHFTQYPLARDLIKPGLALLAKGDTLDPNNALPRYIRNKVTN